MKSGVIVLFVLAVGAVAYGISYAMLLSAPGMDRTTRLAVSGVLAFLFVWGAAVLAPKL